MKIKDITDHLENFAPLMLQESYDNAGLIVGDKNNNLNKILLCLDVTEKILEEAIENQCNLIISHHPLIFKSIKKINGKNQVERILLKAIKKDICIYAIHTNLDNVNDGVNSIICQKLGIKNTKILLRKNGLLRKLITFCPVDNTEQLKNALFEAGAGHIGNYDCCSFSSQGTGSFRPMKNANPYVGNIEKLHHENEIKIETIYPVYKQSEILTALFNTHPYEEVAYDIYPLQNEFDKVGAGMIGELETEINEMEFLNKIKKVFKTGCIRHSELLQKKIKRIAVCGGSGSFLIKDAIANGADMFLTSDIKYHDFFEANNKIVIADIGHYESEYFTKELIYSILIKKFPNFAIFISELNTNSVNYL
ncbi:MAG: Nif3-like dinuclear metal center hexameric protein [Bacteroidales bacterium]|nr:Nif3-like dinuclear metal center hexameric protein [Bacteroidales bacterium]